MDRNLSGEAAAAAALAHLLTDHPELGSLIWTVGETPGVLTGHQITETGHGEIVDTCAEVMGGHVARTSNHRNVGGQGIAQLVAFYDDVPVKVWVSYPLPNNTLNAAELRRVFTGRHLGTVADLEGGDEK
ncbi:hypothetical protein DI272_19270 [Streptomyces sp. Act143]|uniref:hypothetical protein n=1 Tax=Streptomyces sp. Act143 TaxID=2200760 RepID=UPI000D682FF9|nr:hypothetical protein [Streptomyces sp. Act143]PWI16071.1 hypothetical protein DI272_19270 [Streptomyces sp. Act143]